MKKKKKKREKEAYNSHRGSLMDQWIKNPLAAEDIGDRSSIPETAKSPGAGNGHPLHYFCLENSMDRGV